VIVFLDTNTLGLLCNPNNLIEAKECESWLFSLYSKGTTFCTSDICDYEVRRGLLSSSIRLKKQSEGLPLLDRLKFAGYINFLAVTNDILVLAADLWAKASNNSKTTKDARNIDIDIIISANYQLLRDDNLGQRVVVGTTNLKHLSLFCEAANWQDIKL
jgi:predicted nucleic acid-binding protein